VLLAAAPSTMSSFTGFGVSPLTYLLLTRAVTCPGNVACVPCFEAREECDNRSYSEENHGGHDEKEKREVYEEVKVQSG
jgi:hypothetical protein